jgi:hypothetical protein
MRPAAATALLLAAVLAANAGCTKGKPATGGVAVRLSPAKATFAHGEPVTLSLVLDNRTGKACRAGGVPEGVVKVVSLTRDGAAVTAVQSTADYIDGFATFLAANLVPVAPGRSLSLSLTSRPHATDAARTGLESSELDANGQAAVAFWPVDQAGRYTLTVSYLVPPLPGEPGDLCAVAPTAVSASFTVSGG